MWEFGPPSLLGAPPNLLPASCPLPPSPHHQQRLGRGPRYLLGVADHSSSRCPAGTSAASLTPRLWVLPPAGPSVAP